MPVDHLPRDELSEEVLPFEVRRKHPVEALLVGLEDVGPHFGRDTGVVDEQRDRAEFVLGLSHESLAVLRLGHVALDRLAGRSERGNSFRDLSRGVGVADVVDGHVEAGFSERQSDPSSDASARARDERDFARSCHWILDWSSDVSRRPNIPGRPAMHQRFVRLRRPWRRRGRWEFSSRTPGVMRFR